ncbi:MAG: hypothetical protein H7Z43_04595 [Clostridia bacterium]|nr:hypothetical protein [Deltaproteobacteria bacterium]
MRELTECAELCTPEQTGAIDALVRYYRANQKRMLYNRYREQAMPIGSGIARKRPSACFAVPDEKDRPALEHGAWTTHGAFARRLSNRGGNALPQRNPSCPSNNPCSGSTCTGAKARR